MPPTPVFETLISQFFHCFSPPLQMRVGMAPDGAQSKAKDTPKCSKSAKNEPKGLLSKAKSVTFRCYIGESGPLLKHQQGLCFHHIMRVTAPPFVLLNSPRERTAHRERFFSHFWLHCGGQVEPKGAQGSPKGSKRNPKASPGTPKIHQKSLGDPTLVFKGAREAPGVPPGRKMTPKSTKNNKKRPAFLLVV